MPDFHDFRIIGGRQFCDGGLLNNTPFTGTFANSPGMLVKDNQRLPEYLFTVKSFIICSTNQIIFVTYY